MLQKLRVTIGAHSQTGLKGHNQDAYAVRADDLGARGNKGMVAVIADGVSHCQDGRLAAQTAVTGFIQDYFNTPRTWRVEQSASQVLSSLNRWLYRHNQADQRIDQQRLTTFTAAVARENLLHVFHIGDSRAYLIREGQIQQLTKDHNYRSGSQYVLSRALGAEMQVKIDYYVHPINQGDLVLLATDGLHQCMREASLIQRLVASSGVLVEADLDSRCQQMIAWAAAAQETDDLTAVMMHIEQLPEPTVANLGSVKDDNLPVPPALKVGQRLDGMEVLECMEATGKSLVYRVCNEQGQEWVLKAPSENLADDAKALAAFMQEEWLTRSLKHEGLVTAAERPKSASASYMLMPLVEGINLRQWRLDNAPVELSQARNIIKQLIAAVRYLHRQGIQHRDLRPENILIDQYGNVTVIDYGSAAVEGFGQDHEARVGVLEYSAPELLLGQTCAKPDTFAIACIAYELLTGHLPFGDKPANWRSYKRLGEFHYQQALGWRPDLPVWVDACLKKALSPDVRERYSTLSEFWQDLMEPNASLTDSNWAPLIERNPLRFWQWLSGLLLGALVVQSLVFWW